MGIFSRKGSRPGLVPTDNLSRDHESIISNGSLKSPTKARPMNSMMPSTPSNIPELPIPQAPDPTTHPVQYLQSIYAIRERTRLVYEKARRNQLRHFEVDSTKFGDTASYVVSIIKRDYAEDYGSIPPHGRWQHFEVGGRPRVDQLMSSWPSSVDSQERCRRLIDLFLVSVLLDAGAGTKWQYKSKESGRVYKRSEGLAVASLEMFKSGLFSGDPAEPCRVDSRGLRKLNVETMSRGLQVTDTNPIHGLQGRTELLLRLADALENSTVFGADSRPGNMLDFLISHPTTMAWSVPVIPIPTFWDTLMTALSPIWPSSRTKIDGVSLGDAWPLSIMPSHASAPWESIVPFHKLTQWLAYSLMAPMQKLCGVVFVGEELMTGLPEYRNGGLLVDTGLLTLKDEDYKRGVENFHKNATQLGQQKLEVVPLFNVDDDVIVEWRAVTVGFLDDLLVEVNKLLGLSGGNRLSLAQMLEAGTWKGGRELAEVSRPNTKEPPIGILSDGTVF